jgi:Spy/CpxP family protein refolding chaperone
MKSFLAFGILAAGLAVATAHGAPRATQSASTSRQQQLQQARQAILTQKLDLTDEQKAQAKKIRATLEATMKATRENQALAPEQRRALIAAAAKSAREPWRALLTPEQNATLTSWLGRPRVLDALAQQRVRAAAINRQLGLTPEQQGRIRELRSQAMAAVKPVRADAALAPAQKNAKVREIFQASRRQIEGVLTPAQRAKLAQVRQRLLAPLGPLGT